MPEDSVWKWLRPAFFVLVVAFLAQNYQESEEDDATAATTAGRTDDGAKRRAADGTKTATTTTPRAKSTSSSSSSSSSAAAETKTEQSPKTVYVIGDTHGDAHCAQHWVNKTGLVSYDDNHQPTWTDPTSHLVFLGDYIDKGPTSKQTVEYVKFLTETFPHHVTAILGNHEMELLLDRDPRRSQVWGGSAYYQMAWGSVHPGEYRNYLVDDEQDDRHPQDELVFELLYNASIETYGYEQERNVVFQTTKQINDNTNDNGQTSSRGSILSFVHPMEQRALVEERLAVYHERYVQAFSSGTPLGDWLEQRPALALVGDTLFVHGGLSPQAAQILFGTTTTTSTTTSQSSSTARTRRAIDQLNQALAQHMHQDLLYEFMASTLEGKLTYELLTFRGNHKPNACPTLAQILPDGVTRLAVGHTPSDSVRLLCQGQTFLALDSALGRWFRNSGNDYCPGHKAQTSMNGNYKCQEMNPACEGQIVKIIGNSGKVEVIH